MKDRFTVELSDEKIKMTSSLGLAHVGDAVYELLVRTYVLEGGLAKNGDLHRATVAYVSAPAQAAALDRILPQLTEAETAVFKRGRNTHSHTAPKNATAGQYAKATGLEALFGWLWLKGQKDRISHLFDLIVGGEENAL